MERENPFKKELEQRLERLRGQSTKGDVSYDLYRWFGERMRAGDEELLEIQKLGFISEALAWLSSISPEGMKYGTATKERRIEKAREAAEKANTTPEEIAAQNNLEIPE